MVRSGEQQHNIYILMNLFQNCKPQVLFLSFLLQVRMFHDEDAYQRCSQIVLGTNLKSNIQFWQITPYNTTIREVNYENC